MIKTGDTIKIKKARESYLICQVGVVDYVVRSINGDVAVVKIRRSGRVSKTKISVDDLEILGR